MSFAYSIGNIPAEHHLSSFFGLRGPIQNQPKSPIDHFTPKKKIEMKEFKSKECKSIPQNTVDLISGTGRRRMRIL